MALVLIMTKKPRIRLHCLISIFDKYEVTEKEWLTVIGTDPLVLADNNQSREFVSWNDCQAFISRFNSITGRNFRLPTEAEWEFAARGGKYSNSYMYAGSDSINDVAWYDDNSRDNIIHAVGMKHSNELGLYDMSGNVQEWCQDWYDSYSPIDQTNPRGASSGIYRLARSGGWNDFAGSCRVSSRGGYTPDYRSNYLGLRLAL